MIYDIAQYIVGDGSNSEFLLRTDTLGVIRPQNVGGNPQNVVFHQDDKFDTHYWYDSQYVYKGLESLRDGVVACHARKGHLLTANTAPEAVYGSPIALRHMSLGDTFTFRPYITYCGREHGEVLETTTPALTMQLQTRLDNTQGLSGDFLVFGLYCEDELLGMYYFLKGFGLVNTLASTRPTWNTAELFPRPSNLPWIEQDWMRYPLVIRAGGVDAPMKDSEGTHENSQELRRIHQELQQVRRDLADLSGTLDTLLQDAAKPTD